jgi:hypothetical protein
MGFSFQAWVPLFVYDTAQPPHFKIGYGMAAMFFLLEILLPLAIAFSAQRDTQEKVSADEKLAEAIRLLWWGRLIKRNVDSI